MASTVKVEQQPCLRSWRPCGVTIGVAHLDVSPWVEKLRNNCCVAALGGLDERRLAVSPFRFNVSVPVQKLCDNSCVAVWTAHIRGV